MRSPNWDPLLQRIVPQRKVVQDACFVLDYRPLNVFAIFPKTIKIILFFNVKLLSDTFREQSVPAKPITKSWGYSNSRILSPALKLLFLMSLSYKQVLNKYIHKNISVYHKERSHRPFMDSKVSVKTFFLITKQKQLGQKSEILYDVLVKVSYSFCCSKNSHFYAI